MDFMELHFVRFRIENWKSLLFTMRVKNVFWNYFLHQNKSLNLPSTAAKSADMETECRNVVYFSFPYSSRIPPPLELFIILTTVCSIQHQEMITLFLSLQCRLAVKEEYKTEDYFSCIRYHWKTDLSCFRGPILVSFSPQASLCCWGVFYFLSICHIFSLGSVKQTTQVICIIGTWNCSRLSSVLSLFSPFSALAPSPPWLGLRNKTLSSILGDKLLQLR